MRRTAAGRKSMSKSTRRKTARIWGRYKACGNSMRKKFSECRKLEKEKDKSSSESESDDDPNCSGQRTL